jgi:hypothetical protein
MTWQRDATLVGAGAALVFLFKSKKLQPKPAAGPRRFRRSGGPLELEWAGYGDDESDLEDQADEGYKVVQDDYVIGYVRRDDYDLAAPWSAWTTQGSKGPTVGGLLEPGDALAWFAE